MSSTKERLISLVIMNSLFVLFVGCDRIKNANSENGKIIDYTPVAGTWKAENGPWRIVISEEGKVVAAVIPMGEALVKPNETTYIEMQDGNKSSYKSGDFTLIYDPEKSEMEITLKIEKIHIRYLDNEIIGKTEMLIGGPLLEQSSIWDAEIIEKFDYGPRFPQDEEDIFPEPKRFLKLKRDQ